MGGVFFWLELDFGVMDCDEQNLSALPPSTSWILNEKKNRLRGPASLLRSLSGQGCKYQITGLITVKIPITPTAHESNITFHKALGNKGYDGFS